MLLKLIRTRIPRRRSEKFCNEIYRQKYLCAKNSLELSSASSCGLSYPLETRLISTLPPNFLSEVSNLIPSCEIIENKYELQRHGKGESYHAGKDPNVILVPSSTEDISSIMKLCVAQKVPIVPYGAGTSLEGHVTPLHGGISLDMSRLNKVEIFEGGLNDFHVKCEPGVTRLQLNEELRHTGMQFVVDPGANATIGGMVSTGASGTTTVKYGTMRDNILALEVILPTSDAQVVKCGTHAKKSSAGYDLVSLMCGSEGTLGVITSITVKLHPIPDFISSAVCTFDNIHCAADAVMAIIQLGLSPTRCELLDKTAISAFNQYSKEVEDMPLVPHLFLEFSGASEASVLEQVELTKSLLIDDYDATNFQLTKEEQKRKELWLARHQLYYASLALRPGSNGAVITDACVPLSKLSHIIEETVRDVEEFKVVGPCFGHAGDGNFHCILPLLDNDDSDYLNRVLDINDRIIKRSIAAGGTCTGEHGIGFGKKKYLPLQYGEGAVSMMRTLKSAIDPNNIMNPGKIVDIEFVSNDRPVTSETI